MQPLSAALLELVRRLDGLGPGPSLIDLAHALQAVPITPADVAPYVQASPTTYNRVPVVLREAYELLVLTWLPGQASAPHDHSGSVCAMRVVQGEAVEGCYRIANVGYVDMEYETAARCGEVRAGHDAGVHSVRNASPDGRVLVTVHVYAPPLKDFRRFTLRPDVTNDGRLRDRERRPTVVIVGGGFSGSMVAAQTLRLAGEAGLPVKIALIERRGTVGEGVAYGTREASHLLNVPAGRMSAWPDRPDDFVRWASQRYGPALPGDFLPRTWYGEYIRESLLAAADDAAGSAELAVALDEARCVARHPAGGWMVHLARESSLRADAVVLAIGHRPPSDPAGLQWDGPRTRFVADPWRPFAMTRVGPDESVVILGSGLTAVDAVLSLTEHARRAPITLVSRRGLLPQAHATAPSAPVNLEALVSDLVAAPGGVCCRALARALRRKVRELAPAGVDWRVVVDGVRSHTQTLWRSMPPYERRRFLFRLRPFWEVHRHRMAPAVAERFRALIGRGDVRVVAGRVERAQADNDGVRLILRERESDRCVEEQVGWVINCTGPMPSNRVESNPAIGSLLVSGWLRADELALGIETTPEGNAITAGGREAPDLFVVGTLRKPGSWESTAVPELRSQAAAVADRITGLFRPGPRGLARSERARA
jgi:uncharacterized NAD(P)/FAD-binding protein YdhS/predicted metal-dependent enzyme (double-stranded beta helix superfamily)